MQELQTMQGLALFVAAIAGLAIAHRAVLRLPTGLPRLVFILPLLPIFFILPWSIPIYHLRAILSFIFLWTVPSKLLLLCWDAGIDYPSSGFLYFATIVMLPIRVRGKKSKKEGQHTTHKGQFWWQFIAVIVILNIYSYRKGLPLWAIYVLYACHIYLGLELMLGGLAKLATACFGVESDPQFNNPLMSASLSEFWGRRWNLVVTTILRSTVYNPALVLLMRAEKHKAHTPHTFSSPSLSVEHDSCVQNASLHSRERANHVASLHDQGTISNHLNATNKDTSHATESQNSNLSFAKQEPVEPGSQIGMQAPSSSNVIDAHVPKATKENGHMTHHSLNSDTHLKPDLSPNPNPGHDLHPETYSESSMPEAEESIKGTRTSSAEMTTENTSCTHHNPTCDNNANACALYREAESNPKLNHNSSAEPMSRENPKPSVRDDASLDALMPQQPVDSPSIHMPHAIQSNSNLDLTPTSSPNPETYKQAARNGIQIGTEKPSLRTRAATMLRARAGVMLSNSNNPDPISSTADSSPNSTHLYRQTSTEQKVAMNSAEKPSLRARAVAMLVTFAVSGLVHELIFYYINKSRATGEVTAFFILHGFATALEVLLKKTMLSQVRLPRPLSIALTMAFLYATAAWLFMPPLTRYNADINTIAEYQRLQSALVSFFTKR